MQSLPKLVAPGGLLVGCDAGFLNGAKIKGSHTAMKTGMLAAETIHAAALASPASADAELALYPERVRESWVWSELHAARNFGPGIAKLGTRLGGALAFVEQNLLRGRAPYTLRNRVPDHARLRARDARRRSCTRSPTASSTFDRRASVFVSSTAHEEDQPCHLQLADRRVPIAQNLPLYDEPAQRYCPAGVYEIVTESGGRAEFRDQRAELRSLQDLRHQGSGAEHHLGAARGRRRTELRRDVAPLIQA